MGKRGNRSRGRNRGGGGGNKRRSEAGDGRELLPKRPQAKRNKKRTSALDPEKHYLPPPIPERDYGPCAISGEPVEDIYAALANPRTGNPARFESVIESLRGQHELEEDERFVYLGRGAFGIVRMGKNEDGRPELQVRERVQYEDHHEKYSWRRELAPGISRDYPPEPQPIHELYTREELQAFPRFDASSAHLSRGN